MCQHMFMLTILGNIAHLATYSDGQCLTLRNTENASRSGGIIYSVLNGSLDLKGGPPTFACSKNANRQDWHILFWFYLTLETGHYLFSRGGTKVGGGGVCQKCFEVQRKRYKKNRSHE